MTNTEAWRARENGVAAASERANVAAEAAHMVAKTWATAGNVFSGGQLFVCVLEGTSATSVNFFKLKWGRGDGVKENIPNFPCGFFFKCTDE